MKIRCITIFCCLTMGIAAGEQSWPARFEQAKLREKTYTTMGDILARNMLSHEEDFDLFSKTKLWLIKQKKHRVAFNDGSLDVSKQLMYFKLNTISSFPLPYEENKNASFFKEYSKFFAILLRTRFAKIVTNYQDSFLVSKQSDSSIFEQLLEEDNDSAPVSDEESDTKFQDIPDIIALAVRIDETSRLAQATLRKVQQKVNPLAPLDFIRYSVPIIKPSPLASLNSSESSQSFTSSTSSHISSNSFNQSSPPQPCGKRPKTFDDDYSDTVNPLDYDSVDSASESTESDELVFRLAFNSDSEQED